MIYWGVFLAVSVSVNELFTMGDRVTDRSIAVTAAIIERDGLVFCARRSPGRHLSGYWEFPGGKIETGETPEQSLIRELKEELNLTCRILGYFATNHHHYTDKTIELTAFNVAIMGGDLRLTDHDSYRWLAIDELQSLTWAPADIPFVTLLQSRAKSNDIKCSS